MKKIFIAILITVAFLSCNDTGLQDTKTEDTTGNIPVNGNRALSGTNLARSAAACTTDSSYSSGYTGSYAKDGNTTTKWCSTNASAQHWIKYNLGSLKNISGFVVRHAGSNGEMQAMNTRYFQVQFGRRDNAWDYTVTVDNSAQASITERAVSSVQAQYVRMYITNCGIDNYARIYEFEVWGSNPAAAVNNAVIQEQNSSVPASISPGQTKAVRVRAYNSGTTTWSYGSSYRLGTASTNSLTWSGSGNWGYSNAVYNARIYLNQSVSIVPGGYYDFSFNITAPSNASGTLVFSVRMVRDNYEWFGETRSWNIAVTGATASPSGCASCIIGNRPDILNFYQANGWSIDPSNWENIIANWCGMAAADCAREKAICGAVCGSSTIPPTAQPTTPPTAPPTAPPAGSTLRGLHWASDRALNQFGAGWNVESIIGVDNQGEINRTSSRIQLAKSRGWQNIVRIDYQNYLAVPVNSSEYQSWTDKYNGLVNQLKANCTLFIVGNEPTNEGQITPQEYIAAFNFLYARKPAGVNYLVAGPANFGYMNRNGYWTDYTWLKDVTAGIGNNDGFAIHTYSSLTSAANEPDPRRACLCGKLDANTDCSFQRFRDFCALIRTRWSGKPVYITEWNTFGFGSNNANEAVQTPVGNYPGGSYMNSAYEAIRAYNQSNSPKIYALCWFVDNDYGGWSNFALSGSSGRLPQAWSDWTNAGTARGF